MALPQGQSAGGVVQFPHPKLVCVKAAVEDTIQKLDLISSLNPVRNTMTESEAVVKAIDERKTLETGYQKLLQQTAQVNQGKGPTVSSTAAAVAKAHAVHQLVDQYHVIRKNLISSISHDTDSVSTGIATQIRKEKSRIVELLKQTTNELILRTDGDCPALSHNVEEEKRIHADREQLSKDIVQLSQDVSRLQKEIDTTHEKYEHDGLQARLATKQLKEELHTLRQAVEVERDVGNMNFEAHRHTKIRVQDMTESELETKVADLVAAIDRENTAFKVTRSFLQGKLQRTEDKLRFWQHKYETEVNGITRDLENLNVKRGSIHAELQGAQEDYKEEESKRERRERFEAARAAKLQRQKDAVNTIEQFSLCLWRVKALKQFKPAKKKKKKGKGKSPKKRR